ncbi:MAG: hypothetical protein QTN59_08045 [Candidatus Electrothrix communis]|nr:MAG: hypothetical protein QTN59_08045 [Candidatus Electrothrix communis]
MKENLLLLGIVASVAVSLNLLVLKLFKQKSVYRSEHSLVGIVTLMLVFSTFLFGEGPKEASLIGTFLLCLIPCYLGTVFPDLDIKYLGIGAHRNALFHSGILFVVLFFIAKMLDIFLFTVFIAGFGIGVASHLLWDLFDRANIRGIPSRGWSRFWLGSNGVLCLLLAWMPLLVLIEGPANR